MLKNGLVLVRSGCDVVEYTLESGWKYVGNWLYIFGKVVGLTLKKWLDWRWEIVGIWRHKSLQNQPKHNVDPTLGYNVCPTSTQRKMFAGEFGRISYQCQRV